MHRQETHQYKLHVLNNINDIIHNICIVCRNTIFCNDNYKRSVTLVLHLSYTVVTLLLHGCYLCCYTDVTLPLNYGYTSDIRRLHLRLHCYYTCLNLRLCFVKRVFVFHHSCQLVSTGMFIKT